MTNFAKRLIAWQHDHGRHDLPWQDTRDPYCIWLSEIMLQQTQVATVVPYYRRFLDRFPDIPTLAVAALDDVMALWSGLGYYARARNLHCCAQTLVAHHDGRFPREVDGIAALPGIGRSTAAAIAAFAFGTRAAILDGNVKRVLCRVFAVEGFPGDKQVEARLWQLAESLLPRANIRTYTQALMDLGATVCTRASPACDRCPANSQCAAKRDGRVAELPFPRPRRALPQRKAIVLILVHDDAVMLERRAPTGIWGGLLALPEIESATPLLGDLLIRRFGCMLGSTTELPPVKHGFTHFQLEMKPLLCSVVPTGRQVQENRYRWLPLHDLGGAALPSPIRTLLGRIATRDGI